MNSFKPRKYKSKSFCANYASMLAFSMIVLFLYACLDIESFVDDDDEDYIYTEERRILRPGGNKGGGGSSSSNMGDV